MGKAEGFGGSEVTPATIEWLDPKKLTTEKGFNFRVGKSFSDNVEKLCRQIKAVGGIDPSIHCVQYERRGKEKLIRGGHTLCASAIRLKLKLVPCIETVMTAVQAQVNLIASNSATPPSHWEQGEVYRRLRDGDEGFKLKPLKITEIAEKVGYSTHHIQNCLMVRESSPEVQEMIISGKVSANAVVMAKKGVTDQTVLLAILQSAYAAAQLAGKSSATEKFVNEVKGRFVSSGENGAKRSPRAKVTPTPAASIASLGGAGTSGGNGHKPAPSSPKKNPSEMTEREKEITEIVVQWSDDRSIVLDDEDIRILVERIETPEK